MNNIVMNENPWRWFCLMQSSNADTVDLMIRIVMVKIDNIETAIIPQLKKLVNGMGNVLLSACEEIEKVYNVDGKYKYTFLTTAFSDEGYIQENVKVWWKKKEDKENLSDIDILLNAAKSDPKIKAALRNILGSV